MNRYTLIAGAIALLLLVVFNPAALAAGQAYSIQFVGEEGQPIPDALFYLYDTTGGEFKNALFRGHQLNAEARISLDNLPEEFSIGVTSQQHFYQRWWNGKGRLLKPHFDVFAEVTLAPGDNVIKLEQTGVISITFAHVDEEIQHQQHNSPVLPYYRKSGKGDYVLCGGIGLWPRPKHEILIHGLPPGDYKFELKPDYKTNDIFWSVRHVAISKKTVTKLTKQGALTVR